jgi:hypothetical protein
MSTDLAGLAADMASFYNLDFDTAFQKIRSGISGETEPLKQLGINMSVANLEAFALQQGLGKTFSEMNQGEQVMLRYQYLMQATADAQGDFARTSDGYANATRKLEANLETLKTTLGASFINTVADAVNSLNGFIELMMPDESKKTVLDDFADIDLKTEEKLEGIRKTAGEARLLTEELDKIGGTKADKAGSRIQQMVDGLSSIDLSQGNAGIVKDFVATLAKDIGTLADLQGNDAQGAKEWLEGIAESANSLDPEDAAGWASLLDRIKEGLPGIEGTEFGAAFFGALGGGFGDVEKQASTLEWAVETLGDKTNKTAEEQRLWLETCKRLVKTIPGLSAIINVETGEVKGGTDAVKEYIKAWENGQTKLAMLGALHEKESALSQRFSDLPGLQLDMAVAERRVREQRKKLDELRKKYGFTQADNQRIIQRVDESDNLVAFTAAENEWNAAVMELARLEGAARDANDAYQTQADALEEAKLALEEYRQTIDETYGAAEGAANATDEFWTANAESITTIVNAANDAVKTLSDYAASVRANVSAAVDNTVKGFEFIGNAAERQEKRLKPLRDEMDRLKSEGKDLTNINSRISDAEDVFGIGNMTENMKSQLKFLQEYKADMEAAREKGFTDEFLSQFADGSVESADWLHVVANASSDQVKELNDLYTDVTKGKKELTDTLTQQQLSVDDTYTALAAKAKEAVAALDMQELAAENTGKTVEGIATGIADHVDSVKTQVDAIISELDRLNGIGINIDFGGFGEVSWKTSTGKDANADSSGRFGLDYVPRDDYIIRAHEGERLLTAQENQIWNTLLNGGVAGFDLEDLGGVMRDNIKPGGNVYLDGRAVGTVISDRQGRSYKSLQRSGWQS